MDCTIPCTEPTSAGSCDQNAEKKFVDLSSPQRAHGRLRKAERKVLRYENKISRLRSARQKRKADRKLNKTLVSEASNLSQSNAVTSSDNDAVQLHVSKHERLSQIKEKLRSALEIGQRICIDLGMEKLMSPKECSRLAQQLGRLYGSNRSADQPFHIYFTSVNKTGHLFQECVRKNCGFENYLVDFVEQSVFEHFDKESLVYLSPDASEVLRTIDSKKIYVIGGLVDETRQKNVTVNQAKEFGVRCERLPIEEFCKKSDQGTYSRVLSVNQVFDILLDVSATGDWGKAFATSLPKRFGFRPKQNEALLGIIEPL